MTIQDLNAHMQRAVAFHQQGDFEQAETLYKAALNQFPKNAEIINLLGTIKSQQGQFLEGIKLLKQALRIAPGNPFFLVNLGETQNRAGKTEAAIKSFKQALLKSPNLPMAHYNLANILKDKYQLDAALEHYEKALEQSPQPEYYYNYGNTLRDIGRMKSALEAYQKALNINPNHPDAHNNLAVVLLDWDEYADAHYHFQQAVKLKPEYSSAHNNLFQFYSACGYVDKALVHLDKVDFEPQNLALKPLIAASALPIIPQSNAEIDGYLERLEQTIASPPGHFELKSIADYNLTPPSIMTYYGRDDRALREAFYDMLSPSIQPLNLKMNNPRPHIGFVVTRGHEGVFLKCMTGLIRNLPANFDITLVCSRPNGRKILEAKLPGYTYLELPSKFEDAVKVMASAKFDLLHYWEIGTDVVNYVLPFFKPARIQMNCWGWPVTSGIRTVDYYMSCQQLESPGSEAHYTEKLIQMSRLPIYYYRPPAPEMPANREAFGITPNQNFYFCTQNLRKLQPDMDPLFQGILEQDPNAMIGLIADKRQAISDLVYHRLSQSMDMTKVRIFDRMEPEVYLGLVKAADVVLDSMHYTGGANTNYDALAAGIPVVTLPTHFHRGRFTQAVYRQIGAGEACIADSPEDFIQKSLRLAQDKAHRQQVIDELNAASPALFEDQAAVDEFVEVLEDLLTRSV